MSVSVTVSEVSEAAVAEADTAVAEFVADRVGLGDVSVGAVAETVAEAEAAVTEAVAEAVGTVP